MTYFFKTKMVSGKQRLIPLPGQYLGSEEISVSKNVKGSHAIREAYPVGTVFASGSLVDSITHYSASVLYPMVPNEDLKELWHEASNEMKSDWENYLAHHRHLILAEDTEEKAPEAIFARELSLFDSVSSEETKKSVSDKRSKRTSEAKKRPAVSLLDEIRRDYAVPSIEDCGFYVSESNWQLLIRNIRRKVNTMLTGPTGTGKTQLVRLIGEKLGLEVSIFDMGSMFDPTVQMLGSHRLEAGSSVFDYAPFAKAVQKPGIVLLDELSRAPITTNNLLFPCLDDRRSLPVEQAGSKEVTNIAVHPDCVFIATANIGSMYTGTSVLDMALVNRFFNLELNYMPGEQEEKVLCKRCGIKSEDAKNIVKVAGTVRNLFAKGELSASVSTRETIAVAELVGDGFPVYQALELTLLPQFEGTDTDGERSVVRSCFMAV